MPHFKLFMTLTGAALAALMVLMFITSLFEKRNNAAVKAAILILVCGAITMLPYLLDDTYKGLIIAFDSMVILAGLYLFIPSSFFKTDNEPIASGQIDERTIMFSRNELKPNTQHYQQYYQMHPEHLENDEQFRQLPGLLSPQATFYNPLSFRATDALFHIVDGLHQYVEGQAKDTSHSVTPDKYGQFIKQWARKSGAVSIGFTSLKDYHWYSVGGRGERYGKKIDKQHHTAIAFTVEMDHEMVAASPRSSIIMESANQYLQAGIIATQIAMFIRNCGFNARAHIDGNYQVVAPLVARDANLGEIGRMGLLMTPEHGPRVRIGVITTDMPLPVENRKYDSSYEDFCNKCLKCAINCPASAISDINKDIINGVERWQINSEKCFKYWCSAGTDCGRCMSTCPYSHPSNILHNMVRWSIRHFPNFRYWAVQMDDFFYGRKSTPAKLPKWLQTSN
ncbi:4Fe-4S dicluster domain-containing protein [Carboxylicivirga sediminis]|uniref:4Fe-4S dicluster domain-containing protein n=1 Tax=Carboxylicivirga sediminis TaxID=2006564 RepID=A0A941F3I0_9BACT|nr:reductive dehalogenase domain-containing protein [Carboxylicivirga sediminis]MBR8536118.1 4Fe-4S dicluster domain-containing protein [Carboxylicivirga sediminis]